MSPLVRYILQRIVQYVAVVLIGITIAFIIPRLTPINAVDILISRAAAAGQNIDPSATQQLRHDLRRLYGLEGSILSQYGEYWKRLFQGSFGPSLSYFPTPVIDLIRVALPWTLSLLTIAALLGWLIGNAAGALAGYYNRGRWANALGIIAMVIFPIPYYIMALVFVALFTFVLSWFPLVGGTTIGVKATLSISFIWDLLKHALLPGLSLVVVSFGGWFITMRSLITRLSGEDYVTYARIVGLPNRNILTQYVVRNALVPQVTGLALSLGQIFGGALITEYVFSYPGLGQLLYLSVINGDVNLLVGIVTLSVVAISTAVLIVDLCYPFLDPRIRYG
jgi:peptide/nickel transport system permease protein